MTTSPAGPLSPYRVLDLTGSDASFCAKILADLGADVVKVEPPGGHPDRVRRFDWLAYAANSRSVELDLANERARFLDLVRAADFLVESFAPGYLDGLDLGWSTLSQENPRLVMTSVTPFGIDGPYRDFQGPDLVVQALGGIVHHVGDADRPPVRIAGRQGWRQAGASAAVGTLVAHFARARTGRAQRVEVSAQVASLWTLMSETSMPLMHGYEPSRDGVHTRAGAFRRRTIFPCRDGYVAAVLGGGALGGAMLKELTRWMAEEDSAPEFMVERDWLAWDAAYLLSDPVRGQQEIDATVEAAGAFFRGKTRMELYDAAVERGLLLSPVLEIPDLLDDLQLQAREFWVAVDGVRHPGPFARLSRTPVSIRRRAPNAGEHTSAVVAEWRPRAAAPGHPESNSQPFSGLRVLDFTWVVTGPITGRLLAEHGADVIKVESARRPDPGRTLPPFAGARPGLNRSQFFANYNAGKRSIALDVTRSEAQEIVRRLVAHTDVLIESFTPGTLERLGLGYDALRAIRPDLIYVSTCQQGQTGPRASFRGYGSLAAGLGGFYALTGWPDREPSMIYGAYTDFTAHHMTSAALLAALDHRRRTGEGQRIDVAQAEASLHFLGSEIMAFTAGGVQAGRPGNADDHAAPHGVYPCQGDDRWCAIACTNEDEWRALARAIGADWTERTEFASLAGRKASETELNRLVGEWTRAFEAEALMDRLQSAGVPAGAVRSCADLHHDPQLRARGAFVECPHPEMGRGIHEDSPFRCLTSPGTLRRAPLLGEHTEDVLEGLLGMPAEEIVRLRSAGVVG